MWVTKLLITQEKKGIFAQKQPNLAQIWHLWSIWARPCRLIQCPVGGSVGGCGARAVSCKTPIYFMCFFPSNRSIIRSIQVVSHFFSGTRSVRFESEKKPLPRLLLTSEKVQAFPCPNCTVLCLWSDEGSDV